MPRNPIELPLTVARRFVEEMRAFHAEPNAIKRDEIAARQLHALKQHNTGKLPDPRIGRRDSALAVDSFFVVTASHQPQNRRHISDRL